MSAGLPKKRLSVNVKLSAVYARRKNEKKGRLKKGQKQKGRQKLNARRKRRLQKKRERGKRDKVRTMGKCLCRMLRLDQILVFPLLLTSEIGRSGENSTGKRG